MKFYVQLIVFMCSSLYTKNNCILFQTQSIKQGGTFGPVWWCLPVILVWGKLVHEDQSLQVLGQTTLYLSSGPVGIIKALPQ